MSPFRKALTLALMIGAPVALVAQSLTTVVFDDPVVTNKVGQPRAATDVFVHNADGSIGTLGKGDIDQIATRAGTSFSVGTGIISIPANNYLNVVFTCGASTGNVCIVYFRGYGHAATSALQYQNFRGPTAITGGTTKVAGNKSLAANAAATTSNLTYATATTAITTGTPAITDFVYPNMETILTPATILKPGDTIGVTISGISGMLASATNAEVKFVETEQPL